MQNMKMVCAFDILSLLLLCLSGRVAAAETLTLFEHTSSLTDNSIAVSVSHHDLEEVSGSVLLAETWLRSHVLAFYPAHKITHIVVGHNLLCFPKKTEHFELTLPALKNLHHSLTRWGLEREIKVSPSLSSHCLTPKIPLSFTKPLLGFIRATNSTYLINPAEPISDPNIKTLLSPHVEFLKKTGFSPFPKINLLMETPMEARPTMRKLSFVIPPLPTPAPEISPVHNLPFARAPLPPLVGPISSPPIPPSLSPHPNHHLPPCNPWPAHSPVPVPEPEERENVWCVAKPSVPAETLQEGMDFACGEGEADCEEIQPNGNCYYPDSLVAHASFAFNSYWQRTKRHGGTCSFGGTAMLINSDPSFLRCRFIVS